MSRINFSLSSFEHVKSFITSGPGHVLVQDTNWCMLGNICTHNPCFEQTFNVLKFVNFSASNFMVFVLVSVCHGEPDQTAWLRPRHSSYTPGT